MTIPYAEVIGDPIAHSKSPAIHKFWLEKLGIEGDYRAVQVDPASLHAYFVPRKADPDWLGCNVTMPLKQAVLPFLGRMDEQAAAVGAVNAITPDEDGARRGHNTDAQGIAECLARAGRSTYAGHVATYVQIVGTGGAARAAAAGAVEAGYASRDIEFFGRDLGKARRLAEQIAGLPDLGLELKDVEGFNTELNAGLAQRYSNVLINASPLGMVGYPPLLVDLATYYADTVVVDLVYDPIETKLVREARRKGLKTIDGLEILIAQAARSFRLFFGADPLRDSDAELRELLTS